MLDALRSATIVPAIFMEAEGEYGSIATGLKADFVLLDRNPLEAVENMRSISGLFHRGQWYERTDLDRLLE